MHKRYRLVTYTEEEELANRLTHGFGALCSLVGMIVLLWLAAARHDPWRLASCAVYGGTLVLFYLMSTLYHSVRTPKIRYYFRILDHASIFLLIAGTYTPFTLVNMRGPWGWSIFAVIWALALGGVIMKIFMTGRLPIIGPILYIAMGWLIIIAIKPLLATVPAGGITFLFAGGCLYTIGVIFYAWDKIPFNHAIWHLFVLAASASHYTAILLYVVLRH